jgi:hypothetical protein
MSIPLTRDNQESHLATIWEALVALEDAVATPEPFAQWDDICTAMAWIREDLGLCWAGCRPCRIRQCPPHRPGQSELEREQQLEDEEVTS